MMGLGERTSRRRALRALVGGGIVGAGLFGSRATTADAADGDPIIAGQTTTATSETTLDGGGGFSADFGSFSHDTVVGGNGCGLLVAQGDNSGVYTLSAEGAGVVANGYPAIQAEGDVVFRASGRLVVPAGASKVTRLGNVSGGNGVQVTIGPNSLIFATIQQNRPGVFVQAAVPSSTGFTIYLNKAVTAKTTVAWFVLTMPGAPWQI
jgi:hypothetical protein